MSVQQLPGGGEKTPGSISQHSFPLSVAGAKGFMLKLYRVAEICDCGTRSAESVFKHKQSFVAGIGTTEIQFLQ